jgi:hypothetical protein
VDRRVSFFISLPCMVSTKCVKSRAAAPCSLAPELGVQLRSQRFYPRTVLQHTEHRGTVCYRAVLQHTEHLGLFLQLVVQDLLAIVRRAWTARGTRLAMEERHRNKSDDRNGQEEGGDWRH